MYKLIVPFIFCSYFIIAQSSQTSLLFPEDEAIVTTTNPTFSYLSSGIDFNDPRLHSFLKIVELQNGQTRSEAITLNTPFHLAQDVPSSSYGYPFGANDFQIGKTYAWNLTYFYNGSFLCVSPIFIFSIPQPILNGNYSTLSHTNNGNIYKMNQDKVEFQFDVRNPGKYKVELKNKEGEILTCLITNIEKGIAQNNELAGISIGQNFFSIELGQNYPSGIYTLTVSGLNRQKMVMKFEK